MLLLQISNPHADRHTPKIIPDYFNVTDLSTPDSYQWAKFGAPDEPQIDSVTSCTRHSP